MEFSPQHLVFCCHEAGERESGLNEVPACFSVEHDADGVLKIFYQKPGRKFWFSYFKIFFIALFLYICFLLVDGVLLAINSPYFTNPGLPFLPFFLLQIPLLVLGTHARISDQTLSLKDSKLEINYHNLPFVNRRSIPKNEVRRLVQSRTDETFARGFNLTLVDSENCPLLIGESAEATRWLGETIVQWAGADCKLVAEDGGRMSNPATIAEG